VRVERTWDGCDDILMPRKKMLIIRVEVARFSAANAVSFLKTKSNKKSSVRYWTKVGNISSGEMAAGVGAFRRTDAYRTSRASPNDFGPAGNFVCAGHGNGQRLMEGVAWDDSGWFGVGVLGLRCAFPGLDQPRPIGEKEREHFLTPSFYMWRTSMADRLT